MTEFLIGLIIGAILWEVIKWAWKKYVVKEKI